MNIRLTETQAHDLIQYAISGASHEVCGLLAGAGDQVHRIFPITNAAVDSQRHYAMNPAELVKAMYAIEAANLSLLGIYHSHPDGDSIPSSTDVQQAQYPDVAYLIIGLRHARPRLGAWQIRYRQVEPVRLQIGEQPVAVDEDEPLSAAQKRAIMISAGMAFIIMLILSLALLPPVTISSLSIR